jgi:hypothetical protein
MEAFSLTLFLLCMLVVVVNESVYQIFKFDKDFRFGIHGLVGIFLGGIWLLIFIGHKIYPFVKALLG